MKKGHYPNVVLPYTHACLADAVQDEGFFLAKCVVADCKRGVLYDGTPDQPGASRFCCDACGAGFCREHGIEHIHAFIGPNGPYGERCSFCVVEPCPAKVRQQKYA
jgi:hypothetical protein